MKVLCTLTHSSVIRLFYSVLKEAISKKGNINVLCLLPDDSSTKCFKQLPHLTAFEEVRFMKIEQRLEKHT